MNTEAKVGAFVIASLLVLGATVLMLVAIAHQSLRGAPRRTNGAP